MKRRRRRSLEGVGIDHLSAKLNAKDTSHAVHIGSVVALNKQRDLKPDKNECGINFDMTLGEGRAKIV